MQMTIILQVKLKELGINSDNDYLLKGIDTKIHKEQFGNTLYFYPETAGELALIDEDIGKIMKIVELEKENSEAI